MTAPHNYTSTCVTSPDGLIITCNTITATRKTANAIAGYIMKKNNEAADKDKFKKDYETKTNLHVTLNNITSNSNTKPIIRSNTNVNSNISIQEFLRTVTQNFKGLRNLYELEISNCELNAETLRIILPYLLTDYLNVLKLENASITDDGVKEIADVLATNTSLTELSLKKNNIGKNGAEVLAAALAKNKNHKITSLVLDTLQIGKNASNAIQKQLKTIPTVSNKYGAIKRVNPRTNINWSGVSAQLTSQENILPATATAIATAATTAPAAGGRRRTRAKKHRHFKRTMRR